MRAVDCSRTKLRRELCHFSSPSVKANLVKACGNGMLYIARFGAVVPPEAEYVY